MVVRIGPGNARFLFGLPRPMFIRVQMTIVEVNFCNVEFVCVHIRRALHGNSEDGNKHAGNGSIDPHLVPRFLHQKFLNCKTHEHAKSCLNPWRDWLNRPRATVNMRTAPQGKNPGVDVALPAALEEREGASV